MSIVNAYVCTGHALVVTDSRSYKASIDAFSAMSKFFPLAHINAVLAARGHGIFLPILVGLCNSSVHGRSFDELVREFPKIVPEAFSCFLSLMTARRHLGAMHASEENLLYPQEGVLVGWSTERDCPHGIVFTRDRDDKDGKFVFENLEAKRRGYTLRPHPAAMSDCPPPVDERAMEINAQAQFKLLESVDPKCGSGGHLMLARIERERMTITRGNDLGPSEAGWLSALQKPPSPV
jgi:hypothetical protein